MQQQRHVALKPPPPQLCTVCAAGAEEHKVRRLSTVATGAGWLVLLFGMVPGSGRAVARPLALDGTCPAIDLTRPRVKMSGLACVHKKPNRPAAI